jgi:hypothetical protein
MVNPAGQGRIRLIANKPIPEEFSLLFGEMLYQLRSALDACIYQAAIYVTGQDPPPDEQKLEFPVCKDAADFAKTARRRLSIFPQAVQDGIEKIQPFNPPPLTPELMVTNLNRALGILHDLARKDRHRKLHVVGQWATSIAPEIKVPPGVSVTSIKIMEAGQLGADQDLAIFQLVGFRKGMVVSMSPNLLTNIGLDEPPPPCHDSDTFPQRLQMMLNVVNSVITAFERYV